MSGWSKPGDKTVTITSNKTTSTSGEYTQQTGSLTVTITPSGAVSAGAQWRVDGGTWRNSGYTQTGLSPGSHTVSWDGWDQQGQAVSSGVYLIRLIGNQQQHSQKMLYLR